MFSALQGSSSRTSSPSTSFTTTSRSIAGQPASSSSSSPAAGLRQGLAGTPRASALDVKGHPGGGSSARADGKGSLSSARLPSPSSPAQPDATAILGLLERIRTLCATGIARTDEGSRQLQDLVARLAQAPGDAWIVPLIEAAGGTDMPARTVMALARGIGVHPALPALVGDLIVAFGANAMRTDQCQVLVETVARMPQSLMRAAVREFFLALADQLAPAAGEATPRRQLPDTARPHLKALFDGVMQRPTPDARDLQARSDALCLGLNGIHAAIWVDEDLLTAVADALTRLASLPPGTDPFWMPPLPPLQVSPARRMLHSIAVTPTSPAPRQLLRDVLAAKLHSAAPALRPEGIWHLYTELAGLLRVSSTQAEGPVSALVTSVVGMHGDLTLAQFHEMVHAVGDALLRSHPAEDGQAEPAPTWSTRAALSFFDAVVGCATPLPAPHVGALAAALMDALLDRAPADHRDTLVNEYLDALASAAPGLTNAQRVAAVMGMCSAYARRQGGREPQVLKSLKSALDTRRRGIEQLGGNPQGTAAIADAFAKGLMLALEPERALQPEAWLLPFAAEDATPLLQVAFGMPVHGPRVAGGLSEMAQRDIPRAKATAVALHSAGGRELLRRDPLALKALHGNLLDSLLQSAPGADSKHKSTTGPLLLEHFDDTDASPSPLAKLLQFYESLDMEAGVGVPPGHPMDAWTLDRMGKGLERITQCMSDVDKRVMPTHPDLARSLCSRLAGTAQALADRLGVAIEVPSHLTAKATMARVVVQGARLRAEAGLPPHAEPPASSTTTRSN